MGSSDRLTILIESDDLEDVPILREYLTAQKQRNGHYVGH